MDVLAHACSEVWIAVVERLLLSHMPSSLILTIALFASASLRHFTGCGYRIAEFSVPLVTSPQDERQWMMYM